MASDVIERWKASR